MGYIRTSKELQNISEEEKKQQAEKQLDQLRDSMNMQAQAAGTLGLEGQDTGPQEGPPIELPSETIQEDLRKVSITPQESQLASDVQPAEPAPQTQPQQPLLKATDFSPLPAEGLGMSAANKELFELSQEDRAERENQRIAAFSEYNGILQDLTNKEDMLGKDAMDRIRNMETLAKLSSPITMKLNEAVKYDPNVEIGTDAYEDQLFETTEREFEMDEKGAKQNALKTGRPLILNRTTIWSSNKLLGVAMANPNFDRSLLETDDQGRVSNRDAEGVNVQPVVIDPSYTPLLAALAEDYLIRQQAFDASQKVKTAIDQDDEIAQQGGVITENISKKSLGKEAVKATFRERAYRKGEPTDTYMDDYNNITELSFDAVGEAIIDWYESVAPHMVTRTPVLFDETTNTFIGGDVALTPEGVKSIQSSTISVPDLSVRYRTQPLTEDSPRTELEMRKTQTGKAAKVQSKKHDQAKQVYGNIPSVIDYTRSKLALAFGLHALTSLKSDPNTGQLLKDRPSFELMDVGRSRMNKILNIAKKQSIEVAKIEIEESQITNPNDKRIAKLKADKQHRLDLQEKYQSPDQLRAELYQHANKVILQPLADIANLTDKTFYHDFVTQGISQRLTAAQVNSYQTSHIMRNVIGHGILEEVKPLSASKEEQAFLWNASTIFFGGGKYVKKEAVKMALFNIKERTPTYLNIVKLGNKLNTYMGNFNTQAAIDSIKAIKTTPKGITGIDKLKGGLPQEMLADTELMTFITALSQGKNAHKHFIQYLDYMMAMADYDNAMKNKTSFRTSVNSVEVDGISNGLASLFLLLGIDDKMYRTGVLRAEGENKVLGMWSDLAVSGEAVQEAYEGNIRSTLARALDSNMKGEMSSFALMHPDNMEKFGYDESDIPALRDILNEALSDEGSFLKPPLMTFPYGQELKNLIGSVYETILLNPKLESMVMSQFNDIVTGAEFIESIRLPAVHATIGPRVVEFAALSKEAVEMSTMFNMMLELPNPTGGLTKVAGRTTSRDPSGAKVNLMKAKTVDPKAGQLTPRMTNLIEERIKKSQDFIAKAERSLEKAINNQDTQAIANLEALIKKENENLAQRLSLQKREKAGSLTVYKKVSKIDPLEAKGPIKGGYARGMVLPMIAHSMDAAAIISLGSGAAINSLNKDAGGKYWMLPIYDATITSLRSLDKVVELVNSNWKNNVGNSNLLEKMESDLSFNVNEGLKKFNKLAIDNGDVMIDESVHGSLADYLSDSLLFLTKDSEFKKQATALGTALKSKTNKDGAELNTNRTYTNIFRAQELLLKAKYSKTRSRLATLVKDAATDRKKLLAKIESDKAKYGHEVLQYAMDDISMPEAALNLLSQ